MGFQEALPAVDPVAQAKAQASASHIPWNFPRSFWNEKQSKNRNTVWSMWENEGKCVTLVCEYFSCWIRKNCTSTDFGWESFHFKFQFQYSVRCHDYRNFLCWQERPIFLMKKVSHASSLSYFRLVKR